MGKSENDLGVKIREFDKWMIQGMSEGKKLLAQVTLESEERKDFMERTLVFLPWDSAGAMELDPNCSPTRGLALRVSLPADQPSIHALPGQ